MYFDTHVHFRETRGDRGLDELVDRAFQAGVDRIVAVGGDCDMNRLAVQAARAHPGHVWAAVGFDRDQANDYAKQTNGMDGAMDRLCLNVRTLNKEHKVVVAIGEMGLDYHYSGDTAAAQKRLFHDQLEVAAEMRLPVVVHSREANADTLAILAPFSEQAKKEALPVGVLHCFTGSSEFAMELLELGFYISFSGIVSFRNADELRAVAREIPGEKILIETDTPFLAPVPHRGKRNEPAFVADVCACLADARGVTSEAMASLTAANAERLFGV